MTNVAQVEDNNNENFSDRVSNGTEINKFASSYKSALKELGDMDNISDTDWGKYFEGEDQIYFAESFCPALFKGMEEVVNGQNKLIPKDPIRAIVWIFAGSLAKVGQEKTDSEDALDSWKKTTDHPIKLNPLQPDESIRLSPTELEEVGIAVGKLIAHTGFADRKLTDFDPNRGDLGEIRGSWQIQSTDKLRLLDTFLTNLTEKS